MRQVAATRFHREQVARFASTWSSAAAASSSMVCSSTLADVASRARAVVVSPGVAKDTFPKAIEIACASGVSGFLAGRGVWSDVVGSADLTADLQRMAVPSLQRRADAVDAAFAR